MPGRNVQRKLGTTRGSPRRSRTAKASRISRHAVKSRCAREWGGWGRLSDDGPGHYNPDPSEGPWGRWSIPPHGGAVIASTDPTLCGSTLKHEGRRQTDRKAADAGSRLKLIDASGRSRLIRQPFSRNGENSPYGMLGGIEETAASFEARFAPRSYPTGGGERLSLQAFVHVAEAVAGMRPGQCAGFGSALPASQIRRSSQTFSEPHQRHRRA
jgi:hypothetical protein